MTGKVSVVGFLVRHRDDVRVAEVIPVVDGRELTDVAHDFEQAAGMETRDVSYGGLIPEYFRFGPLGRHFLAAEGAFVDRNGKVPLLGCQCGEWGCWPLLAAITVTVDEVQWSEFEQPYWPERDYTELGPFRFERSQYEEALRQLELTVSESLGPR